MTDAAPVEASFVAREALGAGTAKATRLWTVESLAKRELTIGRKAGPEPAGALPRILESARHPVVSHPVCMIRWFKDLVPRVPISRPKIVINDAEVVGTDIAPLTEEISKEANVNALVVVCIFTEVSTRESADCIPPEDFETIDVVDFHRMDAVAVRCTLAAEDWVAIP